MDSDHKGIQPLPPALLLMDSLENENIALCTEHPHRTHNDRVAVCHDRVGIIFFSGMLGSVWGSSRRLQIPYVIPRPGVPRHIQMFNYDMRKCYQQRRDELAAVAENKNKNTFWENTGVGSIIVSYGPNPDPCYL